jgi:hypothetical protein
VGALTDAGFDQAVALGAALRQRYASHSTPLVPPQQYDGRYVSAHTTAVRRTATTLRGVLTGLYPRSSAVVPVAVRPAAQDWMTGDLRGCPALRNLSTALAAQQALRGALRCCQCGCWHARCCWARMHSAQPHAMRTPSLRGTRRCWGWRAA